jgi:hypothetical protein
MANIMVGISFTSEREIVKFLGIHLGFLPSTTMDIGYSERLLIEAALEVPTDNKCFERISVSESADGTSYEETFAIIDRGQDIHDWIYEEEIIYSLFRLFTDLLHLKDKKSLNVAHYEIHHEEDHVVLFGYVLRSYKKKTMNGKDLENIKKKAKRHMKECGLPVERFDIFIYQH